MPPFMALAEWQNDHEVYKRLEVLLAQVRVLEQAIADTVTALRQENTAAAIPFYKTVKMAGTNIPYKFKFRPAVLPLPKPAALGIAVLQRFTAPNYRSGKLPCTEAAVTCTGLVICAAGYFGIKRYLPCTLPHKPA